MTSCLRLVLIVLMLVPSLAIADTCRQVLISGDPGYPPLTWGEEDELTGASTELARRALSAMGIGAKARVTGPWARVLKVAERGSVDIVIAAYETEERKNWGRYSIAFDRDAVSVWVRAGGGFGFEKLPDLRNRRGVTTLGDSFGKAFDDYAFRLDLHRVSSIDTGIKLLLRGRADYLVQGFYPVMLQLRSLKRMNQLEALPRPIASENLHMIFSRRSPCFGLAADFDRELGRLIRTGLHRQLVQDYARRWMEGTPGS